MSRARVALCQLAVGADKKRNVANAVAHVRRAAQQGAGLVVLPECFNAPYGPKFFPEYAEAVPEGDTCAAMSAAARDAGVWLVAGSIAERAPDGTLYNTSTTYSPTGAMVAKYRKIHLFRIFTPKLTFDEAETLKAGSELATVDLPFGVKMGMAICFDIRYPQLAALYQQRGTGLLVYPGAFNMVTGPAHWQLAAQSRAVDNQQFVIVCSPARDTSAGYVAYGHSMAVDPWGRILCEAGHGEEIVHCEMDFSEVAKVRQELPILSGTRADCYSVVAKL
eukprot:TRINITY_DN70622_c0_g1_i1.p1 TRINITY_DN70622_c0_g1~~TRINITY_DN70622_c0_g1_i1.p1  ORF type:complete len:306 (+),score=109.43 TRINITY_DN70622_c0_g1_i1:87-920(+)